VAASNKELYTKVSTTPSYVKQFGPVAGEYSGWRPHLRERDRKDILVVAAPLVALGLDGTLSGREHYTAGRECHHTAPSRPSQP